MSFDSYEKGGVLVVRIKNERLDAGTAPDFKKYLSGCVDQGYCKIVLNLDGVDFIDSSGLGAIVTVLKKVSGKGDLCICSPTEPVENMFKLTRMERVFKIFDSEQSAVESLRAAEENN